MSIVIFDTESNGFVEEADRIWIIVAQDFETREISHFYDQEVKDDKFYKGSIKDGLKHLASYDVAVCHNYIGYDLPLMLKLYPEYKELLGVKPNQYCTESGKVLDTLVLSHMLDPERLRHGVDSYGKQFGIPKPAHEDWTQFSEEMIHRCHEDVRIQTRIYNLFHNKAISPKWAESIRLEHELAEVCTEMQSNRWTFDRVKGEEYVSNLKHRMMEIEQAVTPLLPERLIKGGSFKNIYLKNGDYTKYVSKWIQDNKIPPNMWPEGSFSRVHFETIQLTSTSQVRNWLLNAGWKPDQTAFEEWNYKKDSKGKNVRDDKGKLVKMAPKMTSRGDLVKSLLKFSEESSSPEIQLIGSFFQHKHRLSLLEGLLSNLDENNTIKAGIKPCGTPTARATHFTVVNIPAVGSFFGEELRSLFIAREGYDMVGWDASALEARVEAHYTYKFDDGAYARELLEGDVHSANAEVFGVDRSTAKGGKYALTYGCSPDKLATTLNKHPAEAKILYQDFWDSNASLGQLKETLERVFKKRENEPGKTYIKGLDGRQIYIRFKHALLNSLFQSGGSIVVKKAFTLLAKEVKRRNMDVKFLGFYHDEAQADVNPKITEEYGKLSLDCLTKAGEYLKLKVEITGEYKIGKSWKDCH